MDVGLLLLCVLVGLAPAAHGAQKLIGWFAGPGRSALDAALGLPVAGPVWGAAAVLAGVLAALAVVALLRLQGRRATTARPQEVSGPARRSRRLRAHGGLGPAVWLTARELAVRRLPMGLPCRLHAR